MIIFFRRLIVLLLLLLQGFTPLVHAHVNMENIEHGFHLHGISLIANEEAQFSSLETFGHSGIVIDINSAIKQKQLLDGELDTYFFNVCSIDYIQPLVIEKYVGFSPHIDHVKPAIHLFLSAPRAPPV